MNATPESSESADARPPVSLLMRVLAGVLVALPVLGIAGHVWLMVGAPELSEPYLQSELIWGVVALAFANLVASYFHRRHTRMRWSIVARILSNLWVFSALVLLYLGITGRLSG
jgi:hypothetical protein